MKRFVKTIACILFLVCMHSQADEITLQQSESYTGCTDAYIYDYPSSAGKNGDSLCVVYEC